MTGDAIGDDIEKRGAFSVEQKLFLALSGVGDGQRIVTVDALSVHLFRVDAGTNTSDHSVAHRFAGGLSAHAIVIVHDVE